MTGIGHLEHPLGGSEPIEPGGDVGCRAAFGDLIGGQWSEPPQQISNTFSVAGPAVIGQVLQLPRRGSHHLGVEKLPQLDPAEQFGEQGGVQR